MEVVVDGNALPECFVDGFTQGIPETLAQGRQAPISATAIRIYKNLFPIFFRCLYRCLGSTVFPGVYHIEYIRQPCDDSIPFRESKSAWWGSRRIFGKQKSFFRNYFFQFPMLRASICIKQKVPANRPQSFDTFQPYII